MHVKSQNRRKERRSQPICYFFPNSRFLPFSTRLGSSVVLSAPADVPFFSWRSVFSTGLSSLAETAMLLLLLLLPFSSAADLKTFPVPPRPKWAAPWLSRRTTLFLPNVPG